VGGRRWEEADIIQNRETAAIEATRLTEEAENQDAATATHDRARGATVTATTTATMTGDRTIQEDQSVAKEAADIPAKVEKAIDRDRI